MGVVYRGEHVYLGKEVAIKVLRHRHAGRQEAIKWFLREARSASMIRHPGIAGVTDFGKSSDGRVFLVMELVHGEPLDFLLEREGRLEPARAVSLGLQIADAIGAAHEQRIIHRDLKPANVMVVPRPAGCLESIKLLDFGVAKTYETASGECPPGLMVGTPEYMAPEVARGGAVDRRADIYSLGVILYEMLGGSVPFRGASAAETIMKGASQPVPPLRTRAPDLDPELDAVVIRALAKRPEQRQASVAELTEQLRRCRPRPGPDLPSTEGRLAARAHQGGAGSS
jgi:serine/threonine-protein kinase